MRSEYKRSDFPGGFVRGKYAKKIQESSTMKAQYNREDDALLLHLGEGKIDHAEALDGMIIHFSSDNRPLLLELLDASDFLARLTKLMVRIPSGQTLSL